MIKPIEVGCRGSPLEHIDLRLHCWFVGLRFRLKTTYHLVSDETHRKVSIEAIYRYETQINCTDEGIFPTMSQSPKWKHPIHSGYPMWFDRHKYCHSSNVGTRSFGDVCHYNLGSTSIFFWPLKNSNKLSQPRKLNHKLSMKLPTKEPCHSSSSLFLAHEYSHKCLLINALDPVSLQNLTLRKLSRLTPQVYSAYARSYFLARLEHLMLLSKPLYEEMTNWTSYNFRGDYCTDRSLKLTP